MYLFKRGSRYHISYVDEDGKEVRISTGRKTKVEATEFLLKFKAEEQQKKLKHEQKTLSEYVKEFERHSHCQHSPKTKSSYRTALNEFRRTMGDRQLNQYGIRDVEEFILKKRTDEFEIQTCPFHRLFRRSLMFLLLAQMMPRWLPEIDQARSAILAHVEVVSHWSSNIGLKKDLKLSF